MRACADVEVVEVDELPVLTSAAAGAARRPPEELYDTESDPHQIRNLAASAEHREVLDRLRAELRRWIVETRDLAFLPETDVWKRSAGSSPWELARDPERYPLERILAAAELVGRRDALDEQLALLADDDSAIRYWAVVGLRASVADDARVIEALREALDDASAPVRIEAAAALLDTGGAEDRERALETLTAELEATLLDDVLRAARTLELAGEKARPALPAMRRTLERVRARDESEDPLLMFVRFSLQAAVGR